MPRTFLFTGADARVAGIGDFNSDGLNDVVVATGSYSTIEAEKYSLIVFYQDNLGYLSIPYRFHYANSHHTTESMAIGDLNNDQRDDVVIGRGDSVLIYFQDSTGIGENRTALYTGTWQVENIKIGDLNNDGLSDMVVCHTNTGYIRVFYQDSLGLNSITYPADTARYKELGIGDVNGDGLNDVIMIKGYPYFGIVVYLQDTSGYLMSAIPFSSNSSPSLYLECLTVGDINNDSLDDVISSGGGNTPRAKTVIWYQDSVGSTLKTAINIQAYDIPEAIKLADLNDDGKQEIIVLHGGWNAFTIYEQDAFNNYSNFQIFNTSLNTSHYQKQALDIGDINNDGKKDIVFADYNLGLVIYYGDYGTTFLPEQPGGLPLNENIWLYPNPVRDNLFIKIDPNSAFTSIKIMSIQGKIIHQLELDGNIDHTQINVLDLQPGIYLLRIKGSDFFVSQRFIKI